jgi:predicted ArsR family transcriptional regulator
MQRDGVVHISGTRRGSTKPSRLYALTPSAEVKLSRAYVPLLTQILHVLSGRMSAREFDAFMREVGRGLLAGRPRPHGPPNARAHAASALLNELGGASEVVDADGALWIRAHSCPLAVTTARHPEACHAVESLLGEFTGLDVANCCDREPRSRCCFEIVPSADDRSSARSR